MSTDDIPPYVEVAPGDLIRSEDWNNIQRRARQSLRVHKHTRLPGDLPDDSATSDVAGQIEANEIADGAVTTTKIADGAITSAKVADGAITGAKLSSGAVTAENIPDGAVMTAKIVDGAVTGAKLADGSVNAAKIQDGTVGTAEIADGAVRFNKLSFRTVNSGSASLLPNQTVLQPVEAAANTKSTIYLPTASISAGSGTAQVDIGIVYQHTSGASQVNVMIRLTNRTPVPVSVVWVVVTFAT